MSILETTTLIAAVLFLYDRYRIKQYLPVSSVEV